MEKMKQLGMREAAQTMDQGKACADALLANALDIDSLSDGHREAFWMGMMATLCGNMAASISAKTGDAILAICHTGMHSAESEFRKKGVH